MSLTVPSPHRWLLAGVMLATIALGWRWPQLGFIVPVAMVAGIAGSFSRGRYVCGNLCPRGSFYDTLFRPVAGSRPLPPLFLSPRFRWGVFALLMTLMGLQIARDPANPLHWGWVFWLVCAVTTAVGVALGLYSRARTWCAFCPIGTLAAAIGGGRYRLTVSPDCRSCGRCEKSCPMELSIARHRGELPHDDCLKCSACVAECPAGALAFPEKPGQ